MLAFYVMLFLFAACGASQQSQFNNQGDKSALAFFYEANSYLKNGDLQTALALVDSAILYNPRYANFYQVKGWLLEQLGENYSAIVAYQHCLKYKNHYPDVWLQLGKLYLALGRYEEAAFYLRKCHKEFPDSTALELYLGETFYRLGEPDRSLDYLQFYRNAVSDPSPPFWKWQGLALYQTGKYQEAVAALEAYLHKVPADREAVKYLGFAKFENGDHEGAMLCLNDIDPAPGDDEDIYLYRARYFQLNDKPEAALQALFEGLDHDSVSAKILFELGTLYYELGDLNNCRTFLNRVVRLQPDYWLAYRYLGDVAEREDNLFNAHKYYKLYLENTDRDDPQARERMKIISSRLEKQ